MSREQGDDTVADTAPRPRWYHRRAIVYPCLLALGYVGWCGVLFFTQTAMVFPGAMQPRPHTPRPPPSGFEQVWLVAPTGERVETWFSSPVGGVVPRPAVIYAHGNAEFIDDQEYRARQYLRRGFSVLLPEYRGYGYSDGQPSQAAITADFVRAYDWLVARPDIDRSRIVFHGKSLGGAVAAALAEERPPAALILESTCVSVASFAARYGVPAFLCRHPFRTDRTLRRLDVPVLIFHGSHDEIIPVSHGRRLRDLARRATYVEMDAGHNDFPPSEVDFWREIDTFLLRSGMSGGIDEAGQGSAVGRETGR